jgi:integrase
MQTDYIYERFDFTLEKYRLEQAPDPTQLSLLEIFEQYREFKSYALKPSSMKNLTTVYRKLHSIPKTVLRHPKHIRTWLVEQNSHEQARRCLMQLSAAYDWAMEQELAPEPNPFKKFKRLKRQSDAHPDPFNIFERDLIITTFESKCPDFANFVKFLFFTGCRPSEACGLRWENVRQRELIFCEAVVEGKHHKGTKTKNFRKFPINEQLEEILSTQSQDYPTVFISEKKKTIDMHNFTTRIWKPLLKTLPIKYRGCYHCRHTFITLCLEAGIPIQQVATWVGNSPEIILRHYAGLTRTDVPEL